MSNNQFEDIAILKTLAELRSQGLLHPSDSQTLCSQLKTDWGKKAAKDMLSGNLQAYAEAKTVIRQFSAVA